MEDVNLLVIVLFFCFFLNGQPTFGVDSIYANQSLSGDQTIISASGNFKLGFFSPGNFQTGNYYLGICYANMVEGNAETSVWVANREKPISNKTSAVLKILDGNLVILNEFNESIWSTNISTRGSNNLVAVLRDDGNLILTDVVSLDTLWPFWQSFDHPGNTWLPGAKISFNKRTHTKRVLTSWKNDQDPAPGLYSLELDENSTQLIMTWNGSQIYWYEQGFFSTEDDSSNFKPSDGENLNETYRTYSTNNISTMSRFVIDSTGQLQQYERETLISYQPSEQCEIYNLYGAFGFCDDSLLLNCACLPGFDRHPQDFSGDCSRQTPLQCGNNTSFIGVKDEFMMINNTKLPEQPPIKTNVSQAGCESTCLGNCSCTAYSYYSGECSIWNSGLYNLGTYKGEYATGWILYIRLAPSGFSSQSPSKFPSERVTPSTITFAAMLVFLIRFSGALVFLVTLVVVVWRRGELKDSFVAVTCIHLQIGTRLKKRGYGSFFYPAFNNGVPTSVASQPALSDIPIFSFEIIRAATDSFSIANKLGEGGFGPVFKGKLANGQEIAVKRLSRSSGQGVEEFTNEVKLISKVQHRNLVKLLGFCTHEEERMLIYEFMPNKSLDSFIFGATSVEKRVLNWGSRIKIIEGIARGLLYLHRDSRLKIIHRDLKASNILLDEHMIPRISDFGMARMVKIDQSIANTNRVVGTYGYMSPEYALHGIFSGKSDVFSFGVLLLEIVSGKRNSDFYDYDNPQNLLGYAWQLWEEDKAFELLDPKLADSCNSTQVYRCIHVALLCVQEHVNDRPNMSEVVFMICNDTNLPVPKKPAFCWTGRPDGSTPLSNHNAVDDSRNEISISSVYGR